MRRLQARGYAHVLPALLRKAYEAKQRGDTELVGWGTGAPRHKFLYADDLADACVYLMESCYDGSLVNIGACEDVTIRELAETVIHVVGFDGRIFFDSSKPDGTPRKRLGREPPGQLRLACPHRLARRRPPRVRGCAVLIGVRLFAQASLLQ